MSLSAQPAPPKVAIVTAPAQNIRIDGGLTRGI